MAEVIMLWCFLMDTTFTPFTVTDLRLTCSELWLFKVYSVAWSKARRMKLMGKDRKKYAHEVRVQQLDSNTVSHDIPLHIPYLLHDWSWCANLYLNLNNMLTNHCHQVGERPWPIGICCGEILIGWWWRALRSLRQFETTWLLGCIIWYMECCVSRYSFCCSQDSNLRDGALGKRLLKHAGAIWCWQEPPHLITTIMKS